MTEFGPDPRSGHEDRSSSSSGASMPMISSQTLSLRVRSRYVDDLTGGVGEVLQSASAKASFPHSMDLRVAEGSVRRFRIQFVRTLAWQHIVIPEPPTPVARQTGA